MDIQTKRVYVDPDPDDGRRVLVDRIWPRGVSKADAQLDAWVTEVAPSDDLRTWFDHDPERFDEFRERYRAELDDSPDAVAEVVDDADTLTLVYAARDETHNNAVVLADYLRERGTGT